MSAYPATEARRTAFERLWAATTQKPVRAHVKGPRKVTLDAMRDDGLVRVVNGGYVLTPEGHRQAAALRYGHGQNAGPTARQHTSG